MDIDKILKTLNLDFSDPETKRGALEAIAAILDSREAPVSGAGNGGPGGAGDSIDIELDPDLIQPSIKHQPPADMSDSEINDEDHILDQIKHNDSSKIADSTPSNDNSNQSAGTQDNNTEDAKSSDTDNSEETKTDDSEISDNNKLTDKSSQEVPKEVDAEESDNSEESEVSDDSDKEIAKPGEDSSGIEDEKSNALENDETDETDIVEDPIEDEEDFLDDKLKNLYDNKEIQAKQESRRIKRERTLAAANSALSKAIASNKSPALIRSLEKAITELESLTEAANKSLKSISDDEFNLLVNNVFDAITALGDSDLTFTTDKERELQAQEIKADISSTRTQQELSAEDIAQIRAETQAIKAREKENSLYKRRSAGSFKGFQDFLNSLYRAIALQVKTNEVQDDSWSAINRRYSGAGVLQPGKRITELPDQKIPVIDFYFDCSGSWTESDIAIGQKAVSRLVEMEENGQIKINIFYFANGVHNDADSARAEGGTRAWNEIIKNIITTQATNVIIMTDSDMEDWWNGPKALSHIVPGYVWYLWRDGDNAPRLPRDLKGRGGTQQFSFTRGDL